jgi:Zn-dependent protease
MAFGIPSQLYASYGFLLLGVALRALGSPFLFFVPGFVAHAPAPAGVSILISLAGPFVNLCIWLASSALVKYTKLETKYKQILIVTGKVNMFLFIFNMIPVPPFDGAAVWNIPAVLNIL